MRIFISMTASRNPLSVCKALCAVAIVSLLVWLCYEKQVGVVPDSENYRIMLEDVLSRTYSISYEQSFAYISELADFAFSDAIAGLFFIYAAISIAVKFYAISVSSKNTSLSIIIYLGSFFLLHDYIQIRVGAAIAFSLLAIHYLGEDKIRNAVVCMLAAIFFHNSSLVILAVFPFLRMRITPLLMIPALLVAIFFKYYDLTGIIFGFIDLLKIEKIQTYTKLFQDLEDQRDINIFNYKVFIFMIANLYIYRRIDVLKDRGSVYFLNASSMGISFFFVLSFFPVLSFRFYEYLIPSIIILYPNFIFYFFKNKNYKSLSFLMISLMCIVFLYMDLARFGML